MTTRFDEEDDPDLGPPGPDHDPDDPLLILLAPTTTPAYLGAPPGRYEEIRRTATRRRRVRTAAGVGMACVVAALIALPLTLTTSQTPRSPTVPQAPPVSTIPPTPPTDPTLAPTTPPPATPRPSTPAPQRPSTDATEDPTGPDEPPAQAPETPTEEASPVPTDGPSTAPTPARAVPSAGTGGDAGEGAATAAPDGTGAP
ncbi:hypothetical protein AB0945_31795 [Streptomyces sp. NPDC005474]|uniref:hypothetical protein n=1 Tax=Streptomyces sp. NPDC005474 TaxID=3154878 RepID=UPI003455A4AB